MDENANAAIEALQPLIQQLNKLYKGQQLAKFTRPVYGFYFAEVTRNEKGEYITHHMAPTQLREHATMEIYVVFENEKGGYGLDMRLAEFMDILGKTEVDFHS